MRTELRKKAKNYFEKHFCKLMNKEVFRKTVDNVRKHGDIKLATTEASSSYLVLDLNSHVTQKNSENVLAIEMKRTQILMNKPVYLGLSILGLSEIIMYEFWYDCVKQKYGEQTKLRYLNTDRFIVYIKIEDIYVEIAKDIEA